MGRPTNKAVQRLMESVGEPPDGLKDSQVIGQLVKSRGSALHDLLLPKSQFSRYCIHFQSQDLEDKLSMDSDEARTIVVSMPPKLRNTIFVKRGGYVVVELYDKHEITGQAIGDIANVVRDKRDWQRFPYWPSEYKESEKPSFGPEFESESDREDEGEEN